MVEFPRANNTFLHHAFQAGWSKKHIDAFFLFFWNLNDHPIRENSNGDDIILTCFANVTVVARRSQSKHDGQHFHYHRRQEVAGKYDKFLQKVSTSVPIYPFSHTVMTCYNSPSHCHAPQASLPPSCYMLYAPTTSRASLPPYCSVLHAITVSIQAFHIATARGDC